MWGDEGQVLYLEHSVESLARGGPWLLGTIAPGISRWRVLKEAETEIHGGSSRRRLYGCAVKLLLAEVSLHGDGTVDAERLLPGSGPPVFEQLLLTWSQVRLHLSPCLGWSLAAFGSGDVSRFLWPDDCTHCQRIRSGKKSLGAQKIREIFLHLQYALPFFCIRFLK